MFERIGDDMLPARCSCTEPIDGSTAGECHQPGNRASTADIVFGDFAPYLQVDLLKSLCSLIAIIQDAVREGKEQGARLIVQLAECLLIALGHTGQEFGVDRRCSLSGGSFHAVGLGAGAILRIGIGHTIPLYVKND